MEKQFLKTYGSGCARNIAFQIFSVALVFGLFIIPALIAALWGGNRDTNFTAFIVILIMIMLASIAGVIIWGLRSLRQRAAYLDEVFAVWGLEGQPYLQNGRRYQGKLLGRQADIYFRSGPTLEINIAVPLNTRAAILFKSEIGKFGANLSGYEEVDLQDPIFRNLGLFALDANWMRNILHERAPRTAIRQLMRVTGAYELRQILVQPEGIRFMLQRIQLEAINRKHVEAWVNDLRVLLEAIKTAPRPQEITVVMTPLKYDTAEPTDRKSLAILGAAVGCSALLGLMLCVAVVSVLITVLSNIPG